MPPPAYTGQCMQIRQRAHLEDELEKVSLPVGFRAVWSGCGARRAEGTHLQPWPCSAGRCELPGRSHCILHVTGDRGFHLQTVGVRGATGEPPSWERSSAFSPAKFPFQYNTWSETKAASLVGISRRWISEFQGRKRQNGQLGEPCRAASV